MGHARTPFPQNRDLEKSRRASRSKTPLAAGKLGSKSLGTAAWRPRHRRLAAAGRRARGPAQSFAKQRTRSPEDERKSESSGGIREGQALGLNLISMRPLDARARLLRRSVHCSATLFFPGGGGEGTHGGGGGGDTGNEAFTYTLPPFRLPRQPLLSEAAPAIRCILKVYIRLPARPKPTPLPGRELPTIVNLADLSYFRHRSTGTSSTSSTLTCLSAWSREHKNFLVQIVCGLLKGDTSAASPSSYPVGSPQVFFSFLSQGTKVVNKVVCGFFFCAWGIICPVR